MPSSTFDVNQVDTKNPNIKEVPLGFCTLHLVPLDKTTIRFYDRPEDKNRRH